MGQELKKLLNLKKNLIWWLVYLSFVAGTALFAFFEYRQSQQEQKEKATRELIFPHLKPKEIQSIILKDEKAEKKPISLFRERRRWKINSPVQDIADRDIIGDWLKTLLAEKVQIIKKGENHWAEYGLDKDVKTIEITTIYGKKLKINISYYSAFDGRFYIQKEGDLLLGDRGWASLTSKEGDDFRSYKIINELEHPSFIEYRSSSFLAHLKWENNHWQWANKEGQELARRPGSFPLAQSELSAYWSSFKNMSFEKKQVLGQGVALGDSPASKAGKPIAEFRIGFLKGAALESTSSTSNKADKQPEDANKISISSNEEEAEESQKDSSHLDVLEIKIRPDLDIKGQLYVSVSDREGLFILSKEKGKELFLTEQKIRDHSYPFQFEKARVAFVDIRGYGADIQFEKKKAEYKTRAENKVSINQDKLEEILSQIPYLSAEKYFKENKAFKPIAHIVLKGKEGDSLLRLDFSEPFDFDRPYTTGHLEAGGSHSKESAQKPKKNPVTKRVFVKSSQGKELMVLPWEDVQALFPATRS